MSFTSTVYSFLTKKIIGGIIYSHRKRQQNKTKQKRTKKNQNKAKQKMEQKETKTSSVEDGNLGRLVWVFPEN